MLMPIAAFSSGIPLPPLPDMSGPELVFLHIPKTAGTSQQNAFKEHYGGGNIFWIGRDCPPDVWRYPRSLVGERVVTGGHKRLSFYPRAYDPLYCAILREPVERAISLFVYYTRPELALSERDRQARAGLLQQLRTKGIDPDSMLDSIRKCRPFRREISNYQCRYLSRGRATFANVRESLRDHDHVIGTVASYERFHRELWDLLDWADEEPVKVNRSRDNYAADYLQEAALVSLIGELNEEDHKLVKWVEDDHQGLWMSLRDAPQRRRRLRQLPLRPGMRKVSRLTWEDAPDFWSPRGPKKLNWPLSKMMVAEPYRLFYMSTPGALDTAIQRVMLDLSPVRHKDVMLALGIERVVEQFVTGLMLEDRSDVEIREIAAAKGYFKFAIVYEPVTRLVDIYQQRFVQMRDRLSQWPALYALAADAQGQTEPDIDTGISFRQFVTAIVSGCHRHRLWLAQALYLPWPDTYDRFYRPDQLPELESDLRGITGLPVRIERNSANVRAASVLTESQLPSTALYADTPAGELQSDPALWRGELVDQAIYDLIKNYYAADFKLYNRTAERDMEEAGR